MFTLCALAVRFMGRAQTNRNQQRACESSYEAIRRAHDGMRPPLTAEEWEQSGIYKHFQGVAIDEITKDYQEMFNGRQ